MDSFKSYATGGQGDARPLREVLESLRFNTDGLIPAIAQQHDSGEVLMPYWQAQLFFTSRRRRPGGDRQRTAD